MPTRRALAIEIQSDYPVDLARVTRVRVDCAASADLAGELSVRSVSAGVVADLHRPSLTDESPLAKATLQR